MEIQLHLPQGSFTLQRYPLRKNETLRAWDAADEYLLQHLAQHQTLSTNSKILIINDNFGTLSVVLNTFNPITLSDSWISQQSTRLNLVNNNIPEHHIQYKNSLDWPIQPLNLILIKAPKTLAFFEDQLIRLQPLLNPKTEIIVAGMVKTMPTAIWKLMEKYLGPTTPSRAQKKARLIFTALNTSRSEFINPYPSYYQLENSEYKICNHANVFSRDNLDIGSRFLLQHLPQKSDAKEIIDLGCGNGIIGLMLAQYHPEATLYFVDESYMAIASAKENFKQAFSQRQANYCIADGLIEFRTESMDLIVCNPPFHQQNTIGNHIAIAMFKESYRVLKQNGELWVIGNRHLAYYNDLKRFFRKITTVASNPKFVIFQLKK